MERHVVDGGYVTNYNDPVVGIKPINQKSIETAMSGKKKLNCANVQNEIFGPK